ncbi:hypothetical protein [Roseibium sediminis]|uniref:hypothetical protein n=1 Tax=Roseibium sediminis TaxID=1775174 RepID=UPI00123CC52F|nr:hypothetical protein [Roseibium sediminis]
MRFTKLPSLLPKSQSVVGSNNKQAGRDIVHNYGTLPANIDLSEVFSQIDNQIRMAVGDPVSPTAGGKSVVYSSAKLFSSLVHIGISAEYAYRLVFNIGEYISEEMKLETNSFSTAHIRRSVSNAILHSDALKISRQERRDLANKYARNYGNPSHAIMVAFKGGDVTPLNYEFLEKTFIPDLAERLTGYRGAVVSNRGGDVAFSRGNIDHMSREVLSSVRRMGIYEIRYETLCAISEDLALQLPHPWFVNPSNQLATLKHDLDRAVEHLQNLMPSQQTDLQFWRLANECFNHICSGILVCYSSVIGGGKDAAPNTLRNYTRLAANGERQNLALWNFCEIFELESHLDEICILIDDFHFEVKSTQEAIRRMRDADKLKVMRNLEWILNVLNHIVERKELLKYPASEI